jgi:hypothetical protein
LNPHFNQLPAKTLLRLAKFSIPVLPLIFGIIFIKPKYITRYGETLRKLKIHHQALSQGPVQRYFEAIFKSRLNLSSQITGSCTQCGNCCLNQQCVFLEPIDNGKFECGVYLSPFRKFSNCGAFPISGEDIERYQCPGYELQPSRVIKIATQN